MLEKDSSGHPEKKDPSLDKKVFSQESNFLRPEQSRLGITGPLEKPEGEKNPLKIATLSPQDIQTRSRTLACEIADNVTPKELSTRDQFNFYLGTKDIVEVDLAKGNTEAALQRLEEFEKHTLNIPVKLAETYYKMGSAGDVKSLEKLNNLLTEEKEHSQKNLKSSVMNLHSYENTSSQLQTIVNLSATEGLPVDNIIDSYAINKEHRDYLKLQYYQQANEAKNSNGIAIGKHYRDEITSNFLTGFNMSDAFAAKITKRLWDAQETKVGKQLVLEKVKKSIAPNFKKTGLEFFTSVLYEPEHITHRDAIWIQEYVADCKNISLAVGQDPFVIIRETTPIDLAIAHYDGDTPTELVTQINETAAYQMSLDIPEKNSPDSTMHNKEYVADSRDAHLSDFAKLYAERGDFESTNIFLTDIADAKIKTHTIKHCLQETKTNSDVAAIIPADLLITHDNDLRELFKVHALTKSGDLTKIKEHAKSLAEEEKNRTPTSPKMTDHITKCLTTAYNIDHTAGVELGKDLNKQLKDADATTKKMFATLQIHCGDENGLRTLFELAGQENDPFTRFQEYAHVARLAFEFEHAKKS